MDEKTERFEMRVPEAFLRAVDDWRRTQPDLPSRAEAIRRLVQLALDELLDIKRPTEASVADAPSSAPPLEREAWTPGAGALPRISKLGPQISQLTGQPIPPRKL